MTIAGSYLAWYWILAYIVVGFLLLCFFDYKRIIKNKNLRFLIVFFVYSFICWLLFDFFIAGE